MWGSRLPALSEVEGVVHPSGPRSAVRSRQLIFLIFTSLSYLFFTLFLFETSLEMKPNGTIFAYCTAHAALLAAYLKVR